MRRGECIGLRVEDVDFDHEVALVLGKGRRSRACPFDRQTSRAMDRYLRVRTLRFDADSPWLWLGNRGRLSARAMRATRGAGEGLSVPGKRVRRLPPSCRSPHLRTIPRPAGSGRRPADAARTAHRRSRARRRVRQAVRAVSGRVAGNPLGPSPPRYGRHDIERSRRRNWTRHSTLRCFRLADVTVEFGARIEARTMTSNRGTCE